MFDTLVRGEEEEVGGLLPVHSTKSELRYHTFFPIRMCLVPYIVH
jgi:hypothetical protein